MKSCPAAPSVYDVTAVFQPQFPATQATFHAVALSGVAS
jgi:hypothetical protein